MAIKKKTENILKEHVAKMKNEKDLLISDLNNVNRDLANLQTRKTNIQKDIDRLIAEIDEVKQDLPSGGIPT